MTATGLAATFTGKARPATIVAEPQSFTSYSQLNTPVVAMSALLTDLQNHGSTYTSDDAVHFAHTLGGAGQDQAYQLKMAGVRDSVLAQIAPRLAQDGRVSSREFAGAMAQAGNAIPASPPSLSARHAAADLLNAAGLAPSEKLVNGFAKIGEAISLQALATTPRRATPTALQMAVA